MEHRKSPFELMRDGYGDTQKETLKGEELESIKKDNPEAREISTIEKLIEGYGKDGKQKEEVNVDPNEIKEEEK
ncbi:hypothetical protein HMPREF3291_22485 [Bacillus sp. HMSC76G11]|nr:hypothetical protein HMPREF3291_22485 [Bacillus sp. HMSC76G11]